MKPQTRAEKMLESASEQSGLFVVHHAFVQFMGDMGAGILLGRLLYWHDRTNDAEKWVYKSDTEWQNETYLSRRAVREAAEILRGRGYIDTTKKFANGATRTHYRLRIDVVVKEFETWQEQAEQAAQAQRDTRKSKPKDVGLSQAGQTNSDGSSQVGQTKEKGLSQVGQTNNEETHSDAKGGSVAGLSQAGQTDSDGSSRVGQTNQADNAGVYPKRDKRLSQVEQTSVSGETNVCPTRDERLSQAGQTNTRVTTRVTARDTSGVTTTTDPQTPATGEGEGGGGLDDADVLAWQKYFSGLEPKRSGQLARALSHTGTVVSENAATFALGLHQRGLEKGIDIARATALLVNRKLTAGAALRTFDGFLTEANGNEGVKNPIPWALAKWQKHPTGIDRKQEGEDNERRLRAVLLAGDDDESTIGAESVEIKAWMTADDVPVELERRPLSLWERAESAVQARFTRQQYDHVFRGSRQLGEVKEGRLTVALAQSNRVAGANVQLAKAVREEIQRIDPSVQSVVFTFVRAEATEAA